MAKNVITKIERWFPGHPEKTGSMVYIKRSQIKSLEMLLELLEKLTEIFDESTRMNIKNDIREDINNVSAILQNCYCKMGKIDNNG